MSLKELEANRGAGTIEGVATERLLRREEDDRRRRLARRSGDVVNETSDTVMARDGRDAFDELGRCHRYAVDRHGQPTLERDFQLRGAVERTVGWKDARGAV